MGLSDKTIEAVGKDIVETTVELIHKLLTPDSALITIYYGAGWFGRTGERDCRKDLRRRGRS